MSAVIGNLEKPSVRKNTWALVSDRQDCNVYAATFGCDHGIHSTSVVGASFSHPKARTVVKSGCLKARILDKSISQDCFDN